MKPKLAAEPKIRVVITRHTGYINMPTGPPVYLLDGSLKRADDPVVTAHPHYFEIVQSDPERASHRA